MNLTSSKIKVVGNNREEFKKLTRALPTILEKHNIHPEDYFYSQKPGEAVFYIDYKSTQPTEWIDDILENYPGLDVFGLVHIHDCVENNIVEYSRCKDNDEDVKLYHTVSNVRDEMKLVLDLNAIVQLYSDEYIERALLNAYFGVNDYIVIQGQRIYDPMVLLHDDYNDIDWSDMYINQ